MRNPISIAGKVSNSSCSSTPLEESCLRGDRWHEERFADSHTSSSSRARTPAAAVHLPIMGRRTTRRRPQARGFTRQSPASPASEALRPPSAPRHRAAPCRPSESAAGHPPCRSRESLRRRTGSFRVPPGAVLDPVEPPSPDRGGNRCPCALARNEGAARACGARSQPDLEAMRIGLRGPVPRPSSADAEGSEDRACLRASERAPARDTGRGTGSLFVRPMVRRVEGVGAGGSATRFSVTVTAGLHATIRSRRHCLDGDRERADRAREGLAALRRLEAAWPDRRRREPETFRARNRRGRAGVSPRPIVLCARTVDVEPRAIVVRRDRSPGSPGADAPALNSRHGGRDSGVALRGRCLGPIAAGTPGQLAASLRPNPRTS